MAALPSITNGCYKCAAQKPRFTTPLPAVPVKNFHLYSVRGTVGGTGCRKGVDGDFTTVTIVPPVASDTPVQVKYCCRPTRVYIQSPIAFTGSTLPNNVPALITYPESNLQFGCSEDNGVLQWTSASPGCLGDAITDTWPVIGHNNPYQPLLMTNFRDTAMSAVTHRCLRAVPVEGEDGLYNLVWSSDADVGFPFAFRLIEVFP